jgi:hypothetical protein
MTVPKTTMYEQGNLSAGENQVGRPGELPDVKPEPEAEPVRGTPDQHLGFGILSADAAHHLRTTCRGNDICH